ncbi:MAG TPA: hypothetical protein VJN18_26065 [Polyangiaceae bacterium]|nr:hypothetical protein [Polyangiaceae bacterium]
MTPSNPKALLAGRNLRIAQIRHPNLVRMLPLPGGAGLTPVRNQGRPLSDFNPAGIFKRFEIEQVVRILLDVLSGLGALHADVEDGVPFVHGEVSPQHIYVDDDGTARLVPLISRHLTPRVPPLENGYTAPELLLGDRGDPRADLFSIGVMLWEALAASKLFPDTSVGAVVKRLVDDRRPRPQRTSADARLQALSLIAEKSIALDPELRFLDSSEISSALRVALPSKPADSSAKGWVDEAPTLAKREPRPAVSSLRTQTPPATVVDLLPESRRSSPPAAAPGAAFLRAAATGRLGEPSRRAEWRRAAIVAGASAAFAAVAGGLIPLPDSRAPAALPQTAARAPSPAAEKLAAEKPNSPAPAASAARAAEPGASAAPPSSAAPSAITTGSSASLKPPAARPRKAKSRSVDSDYGI